MRRAGCAKGGTLPASPVCCASPRGWVSAATALSLGGKKPTLAEGLHLKEIKNEKIILARTQGAPLPGWGAQVLFFHNPTQTSP